MDSENSAKGKKTIILQKPSAAVSIRVKVDLSTVQRKFYDALLYFAKSELRKNKDKSIFTVPLSWLKTVLNRMEANEIDRNNNYYLDKLKELKHKEVQYNILNKDKGFSIEGWVSLMSMLEIKKSKDMKTEITFELPQRIRELLIDPNGLYANIDLVVIKGLSSKYAIILYELCKDYENVEVPEMTIEDFRKVFNVENKYMAIADLRKRVLDPAVRELNENDKVSFLVSYELIKSGVKYTHIKFHVQPKPAPELEFEVKENDDAKELLALIPSEYRRKNNIVSLVLGSLKENGKKYTKAQIEYAVNKLKSGKVKDFTAFLTQAVNNDYASFKEIDDIGFVTVEDAVGYRGDFEKDGKSYYVEIAHIEIDNTPTEAVIGYDKERTYLVRLDSVETGEVVAWQRVGEKSLLKIAKRNIYLKRRRKEARD